MGERIYVAFLIGVGRNSATFATITHYNRDADNKTESRSPNIATAGFMGAVFYEMDRAARTIRD